jgi:hypothetical protein
LQPSSLELGQPPGRLLASLSGLPCLAVELRRVLIAMLGDRHLEICLGVGGGLLQPGGLRLGERHGLARLRDARLRDLLALASRVIGERLSVLLLGVLDTAARLRLGLAGCRGLAAQALELRDLASELGDELSQLRRMSVVLGIASSLVAAHAAVLVDVDGPVADRVATLLELGAMLRLEAGRHGRGAARSAA